MLAFRLRDLRKGHLGPGRAAVGWVHRMTGEADGHIHLEDGCVLRRADDLADERLRGLEHPRQSSSPASGRSLVQRGSPSTVSSRFTACPMTSNWGRSAANRWSVSDCRGPALVVRAVGRADPLGGVHERARGLGIHHPSPAPCAGDGGQRVRPLGGLGVADQIDGPGGVRRTVETHRAGSWMVALLSWQPSRTRAGDRREHPPATASSPWAACRRTGSRRHSAASWRLPGPPR